MKKKFITKLILSGAALAASAATLVSTTYAWYVQNTQVTATGVSGTVKDNDASSIFISKDYNVAGATGINAGNWLPSVEFDSNDFVYAFNNDKKYIQASEPAEGKVYNGGLDPITLDDTLANNGKFVDVNGNTSVTVADTKVDLGGASLDTSAYVFKAEARVIEFNLYVRSNVNTTIRPYLIINNTTVANTALAQTAFRTVENGTTDVAQGSQFWIDAVQALRMQVIVQSDTNEGTLTANTWGNVAGGSNGIYDVLKIARSKYDLSINTPADHYVRYTPKALFDAQSGVANLIESQFGDGEDVYTLTRDASVVAQKQYYTRSGTPGNYTYNAVANPDGIPNQKGYYEKATLKGANAYYKALTGNTPTGTFAERAELVKTTGNNPELVTDINTTSITANTAYKFTFRIWLEGTDPACFDSCGNQTFDINVNFDVVAA